jgi:hypothetical protein
MSDIDNDPSDLPVVDEFTALKARADQIGLKYHPNIGLDTLRERVKEALASPGPVVNEPEPAPVAEAQGDLEDAPVANAPSVNALQVSIAPVEETAAQRRFRKKREANELIRIRIQCMNPNKKEWEGELFTAGNSVIGSFTKFVPFDVEDGWHVPRIIYNQIVQRQCQVFTTTTDSRGNKVRTGKLIREFAIEILPQLTTDELHDLAQRQAMAKSIV